MKTIKMASKKTSNKNPSKASGQASSAALKAIASFIVAEAKRLGATDCDVSISASNSVDTTIRLGVVEQLEGAQSRSIDFRAFVVQKDADKTAQENGQKSASQSTSDFRRPALTKMVKATIAMAMASEADPYAGLPDKCYLAQSNSIPDLGLFDQSLAYLTAEEKIQLAIDTEAAARNYDERITNSEGASFSDSNGTTVYANSRGFLESYQGSRASLGTAVVASEDGKMQVNYWQSSSRSFNDLESPAAIGIKAAQRTLAQLGAKPVKSQDVPVVFDPEMAAQLLSQFVGATSGTNIYRKSSFLIDKLGEVVASKLVTIIDDPLMPGKLGSRPFDGEGMPLKLRTIVSEGKLDTYLINSYAARKLNCEPNSGSTGNVYLKAGQQTPEEIIASVKNGLYLTSVSGPGFNAVTGDYSRGASGMWIENGKLAFPVSGITIASNVLDMFTGIIAVGNDLEFHSTTNAPTILIDKMSIAGE